MKLFKNDTLKKQYKIFTEKTIFEIFECNYCNLTCCKNHYRFDCCCKQCRIVKCHKCHRFDVELDSLMKAASQKSRVYIFNFVRNFFATSNITLEFFYGFNEKREINIDDLNEFTWRLRMYHGTKYSMVESLSKTMSFTYTIRNRRCIYNLK